jgi:DNA polymerase-3 subunit alpha
MGSKAALRDVARVMDIPLPEVDRVAKLVPFVSGRNTTMEDALAIPEFKEIYDSQPHLRELIDTATKMEGTVRNAGTHAAGVVISDKPIVEYLPLHRPTSNSEETPIKTVTQFEMGILDSLGMLKVDFLGLITLSVMARACDMIEKRHGIKFDLDNIPLNDPKSFELMGSGQTAGVFQVEGGGMTRWLVQMKPKSLDNIIAMVALYRPGPMAFIPDYIARMRGEAEVEYRHPKLEPIFKDTYGIPVYQEQLMRAAVELAAYTPSESDELRKAISKKKKEDIEKHRNKFVNGAVKEGMEKEIAEAIYSDWEEFARYGFNKSHAADYGVIAVETAYLKAHYPAEYMAATLTASASQTEKVALYVADARSMGVPVLVPEINASFWDFAIEDVDVTNPDGSSGKKPSIRFGFGAVKNAGQAAVELIIKEREANGKFKDLNDFARRVDLRAVGKRALECLIKVGALDVFGNRAALLASLDRVVAISNNHFRAAEAGQMSLFGESTGVVEEITLPEVNNVDKREMLNWERELIGLYISDHPLTPYQETFRQIVSYFSGQLNEAQHEEKVRVAGLVTSVRPYMTKNNKPMGFVTLEDIQGNFDLVLFPRTWDKTREMLTVGQIVIVEGKVDTNSTPPKILVDTVRTEIKILEPLKDTSTPPQSKLISAPDLEALSQPKPDSHVKDVKIQSTQPKSLPKNLPVKPSIPPPIRQIAEKPVESYTVDSDLDGMPPPPDNFPDGWDSEWQPSFEDVALASKPEPKFKKSEEITPPRVQLETAPVEMNAVDLEQDEVTREAVVTSIAARIPLAKPQEKEHPPQQITVMLRSTGDRERDKRRIKTIFGTLISFHGRDRFSFQIFENGSGYLLDFPNDTTRVCPEMLERLKKLMGEESWRVEEITFQ